MVGGTYPGGTYPGGYEVFSTGGGPTTITGQGDGTGAATAPAWFTPSGTATGQAAATATWLYSALGQAMGQAAATGDLAGGTPAAVGQIWIGGQPTLIERHIGDSLTW